MNSEEQGVTAQGRPFMGGQEHGLEDTVQGWSRSAADGLCNTNKFPDLSDPHL